VCEDAVKHAEALVCHHYREYAQSAGALKQEKHVHADDPDAYQLCVLQHPTGNSAHQEHEVTDAALATV